MRLVKTLVLISLMAFCCAFPMFSETGNEVALPDCDDCCLSTVVDIPAFPLYGDLYTQVTISSNALIVFGGECITSYSPTPFPITDSPVVAVFWADADLRPSMYPSSYLSI